MFEHLEAEIAKNRGVFEKALQEQVYRLSNEEQEELRDSVEVAVPKLMARMHVNVVQNMLSTIAQQLPGVVGGLIQAKSRSREREDSFYQRWPQLDRGKHGETVKQLARSFMHTNPGADLILLSGWSVLRPGGIEFAGRDCDGFGAGSAKRGAAPNGNPREGG
jgi:hypothetical protein